MAYVFIYKIKYINVCALCVSLYVLLLACVCLCVYDIVCMHVCMCVPVCMLENFNGIFDGKSIIEQYNNGHLLMGVWDVIDGFKSNCSINGRQSTMCL